MVGPDIYLMMGAIAAGIGVLFGAWAVHHDRRAVEAAKKRAAEPKLPFGENRPDDQRAHA